MGHVVDACTAPPPIYSTAALPRSPDLQASQPPKNVPPLTQLPETLGEGRVKRQTEMLQNT